MSLYSKDKADDAILRYLEAKKVSNSIKEEVYSYFIMERVNSSLITRYSNPFEYSKRKK